MQVLVSSSWVGARNILLNPSACRPIRALHSSSILHQPLDQVIRSERLLVFHSTATNPYTNLALEHYLLTQSHPASRVLLFYTNRPCVVIGRNQNPWFECNLPLLHKGLNGRPIDLIRRRSGGGTVFHDEGNLNFSVIVPNEEDFSRKTHAEMMVRGIKAADSQLASVKLFQEIWVNERHDIVIKKQDSIFKVSGSAFKLTRGRALHHGTLLHSSPNLISISSLLKSPGAAFIQAKGVESVRSPVSNLYDVSGHPRDQLLRTLTDSIVKQFSELYGHVSKYVVDPETITLSALQDGLSELQTDDWRFGQTPRFTFTSPPLGGQRLSMTVNRGIVEDASSSGLEGLRLAEIRDWSMIKETALSNLLSETFPFLAQDMSISDNASSSVVTHQGRTIKRMLGDGSIEVEPGHNTIEQI